MEVDSSSRLLYQSLDHSVLQKNEENKKNRSNRLLFGGITLLAISLLILVAIAFGSMESTTNYPDIDMKSSSHHHKEKDYSAIQNQEISITDFEPCHTRCDDPCIETPVKHGGSYCCNWAVTSSGSFTCSQTFDKHGDCYCTTDSLDLLVEDKLKARNSRKRYD